MSNKCGKTSFLGRRRKRVLKGAWSQAGLSHAHARTRTPKLAWSHSQAFTARLSPSLYDCFTSPEMLLSAPFFDKRRPASFLHALLSCAKHETSKITRGGKKDGGVGTEHYWFNAWVHKLLVTRRRPWSLINSKYYFFCPFLLQSPRWNKLVCA